MHYVPTEEDGKNSTTFTLSDFVDIACPPTFEGEDPGQFQQQEQGEENPEQSSQQQQHRRT